ncbi:hypothetical protein NP233_g10551 [Leucocoprinus birnbaumii]|uniref:Uncharacterized protein n=1 Tax=Leucocoprinus birnbaumii TaxID=56174 RepID=A0AAD5VI53_9AGAR|nr:hypothetical protein NP233_g10551 [Leucocoprinus birnbaumii]
MLDNTTDSQKLTITCRFIQHDQWLTTRVQPQWTVRQLKLWLVHRLFGISIPARTFTVPAQSGSHLERPPSPITFAPDPRNRPASPIIFAAPQKSGFYGSGAAGASADGGAAGAGAHTRELLSDTDEDLLSGSESGFSSVGKGKGKGRMDEIRIETGPQLRPSSSAGIPGGRIGPAHSDSESLTGHTTALDSPTTSGYAPPDADRFPGGVNPHHWTIARYSTGQILGDDEQLSWYDIAEFELLELHGFSFPSAHTLYEYQVCHLWNPERHRERERLRKKLKKRFEAEAARGSKEKDKDKDGAGGGSAAAKRAAIQAQILKAMNLNSGAGANVGVVEYYGTKLASTPVELTLTRLPRQLTYISNHIGRVGATTGHPIPIPVHTHAAGSGGGGSNALTDPYKYGAYAAGGAMVSGFTMGVSVYHGHSGTSGVPIGAMGDNELRNQKIVRVEWRERWVKIHNGVLVVLKDREDEEATHILPLKSLLTITDTSHLSRYLSYTGFNPPLDHPSVNPEIIIPALNLPIQRPPMPTGYSSKYHSTHPASKSKHSSHSTARDNYTFPDSDDSDSIYYNHNRSSRHGHSGSGHGHHHSSSSAHGHGHHTSLSGGVGGSSVGGGSSGIGGGGGIGGNSGNDRHKAFNFNFPSNQHLQAHTKARELTPLVGSRFDPTYLPVTIDEQKASGLRVVCLQFRKSASTTSNSSSHAGSHSRPSGSSYLRGDDVRDREREGGEIDPITLALEDMKERASEWGGIRSDNLLWKCPENNNTLRREPPYLRDPRSRYSKYSKAKASQSAKLRSGSRYLGSSSVMGSSTADARSFRSSDARSSTIRGLGDSASILSSSTTTGAPSSTYYDYLGYRPSSSSSSKRPKSSSSSHSRTNKQRIYDREERLRGQRLLNQHVGAGDVDIHGILAAQIFGGEEGEEGEEEEGERGREGED